MSMMERLSQNQEHGALECLDDASYDSLFGLITSISLFLCPHLIDKFNSMGSGNHIPIIRCKRGAGIDHLLKEAGEENSED